MQENTKKRGRPRGAVCKKATPMLYRVYKHGRLVGTFEKTELKERFDIPLKGLKGKIKAGTIFNNEYTVVEVPLIEPEPEIRRAKIDGIRCASGVRFSSGGKMWRR